MKQADIFVSVICCTYNHETYIRQCLEGFMMQKTNFAFEVLVHDDASTDKTADIVREYESKYPDIIKPIYQTENQYSKRVDILNKFQVSRAQGKYIAICEGDDYWIDPLKLQKQVDFLEINEEYSISHTAYRLFYELNNTYSDITIDKNINPKPEDVLKDYHIRTLTMVCKKTDYLSVIDNNQILFDRNFLMSDTQLFFCLMNLGKVHYLSEFCGVYRVNVGSATMQTDRKKRYRFYLSMFEMRKCISHNYKLSTYITEWIDEEYNKSLLKYKCFDKGYIPIYEYKYNSIKDKLLYLLFVTRIMYVYIQMYELLRDVYRVIRN